MKKLPKLTAFNSTEVTATMTTTNRFMSDGQLDLLRLMLNRIIPKEGTMPGAGDLGLAEFVEGVVGKQTSLRRLFSEAMAQVDILAGRRNADGFGALDSEAQDVVLKDIEGSNPVFFDELVRQAYNGYYTNRQVFERLDYAPPTREQAERQPELLDESLLEQQRKRAPFWRQV